ncbi:MAG: ABC transporter ATP-binding protein [Halapricum sp.]
MTEDETTRSDGGISAIVDRSDDADVAASEEGSASDPTNAAEFVGEDLVIGYPSMDEPVIDEESIEVPPGGVTALVGPNGSGKSTLLKGLASQLDIDEGQVLVDGTEVRSLSSKELARRIGLLSQENTSPDSLTVEKMVAHGRYPHRGFFETLTDEDREAIDEAIELAGIDHLRERELGSLSGGQKQLAWIAMVLAQDTDVVMLDEPTTFLDLHHQLEVMEIVEMLRERDITVVVVLHDLQQAARHADYMIALRDGEIIDWGPSKDVVTEQLLADVFRIEAHVSVGPTGPEITPLRPLNE